MVKRHKTPVSKTGNGGSSPLAPIGGLLGTVKEYENNAKRHPDEQIAQIMESIRQFGNCDPIGVWHDQEKGADVIVEGHGRLMALMEMGETEIPVIRLDHLTNEQRRAYGLVHKMYLHLIKNKKERNLRNAEAEDLD